jgi:hypothetical protein
MALNLNKIKGLFIIPEDEIEGGEKKTEPKKEEVKKTETKKNRSKKNSYLNWNSYKNKLK